MNTPSPLVPQGTSPDRGKTGLYFKILMILSLHVVVIGGMLLQGCKDMKNNQSAPPVDQTAQTDTNPPPPAVEPPPLAVNTNPTYPPAAAASNSAYPASPAPASPAPASGSNPAGVGMNPQPANPPPGPGLAPAPAPAASDYVVARGDTLANIAKKNNVSLKALMAANPGVNPRKLKIGAKLQLPEGATPAGESNGATAASGAAPGAADTGDTSVYTVKAGDMLGRIARSHGTTVAKIKALNDLKTTSIRVGQKLKLPAARAAAEPAPTGAGGTTETAAANPSPAYAAAQPLPTLTH